MIATALAAEKLDLTAENIIQLLKKYVYIPANIPD